MADFGAPISKEEADHLFGLPKDVVGWIQWFRRVDGYGDVTVELIAEDGTPMTVRGWSGRVGVDGLVRRYGFSLLYRNSVVIRRWDSKPGHLDPISGKRMAGAHKHYADERFGDSPASEVEDVRLNNAEGGLLDFLKECGVSVRDTQLQKRMDDFNG